MYVLVYKKTHKDPQNTSRAIVTSEKEAGSKGGFNFRHIVACLFLIRIISFA